MNVTVEKLPKCLTEVSAIFPADDVKSEKASILSSYSNQARIPGFRPGKAPKRIIEKRFAKEIEGELEHQFFNKLITHTVQEEKINFLNISDRKFTHETDGSVKTLLSLIVSPEFELKDYKGIAVTVPELNVTEEMVDAEILQMRQQQAQFPTKEDGTVENGDIVVISYTSTINGQNTTDAIEEDISPYDEKEDYWLKVGEDHFLPDFSSHFISMVPGSEKQIDHTFSDEFAIESLRGKTFTYTATLKEIKEEQLPELEEFVKKMMGDEADVESFRERVKAYATQQQEKSIRDQKVNSILDTLAEGIDFELPDEFLTAETQSQTDHLVNQSMNYGMDEDSVMKMQDNIIETAEKNAAKSLKNHFIMQKIAQLEEIQVEDQEIQQKIFMDAYQKGQDPQKAMKEMKKGGDDYNVRQSILMEKVVDFLVEEAKVTVENAKEENDDK